MLLFVSFKTIQATKLGKNTYTQELSSEKLCHYCSISLLFTYAHPFLPKTSISVCFLFIFGVMRPIFAYSVGIYY